MKKHLRVTFTGVNALLKEVFPSLPFPACNTGKAAASKLVLQVRQSPLESWKVLFIMDLSQLPALPMMNGPSMFQHTTAPQHLL